MNVFFDYDTKELIDSSGSEINNPLYYPEIPYQSLTEMLFHVRTIDEETGELLKKDLLHVSTWKCAVDKDYLRSTPVMTRTLNENIDSSDAVNGNIVIQIDADTSTFFAVIDGMSDKTVFCNIIGYNAEGRKIEQFRFPVKATNDNDANSGDPGDPISNFYEKSEVDAIKAGLEIELETLSSDISETQNLLDSMIQQVDDSRDSVELLITEIDEQSLTLTNLLALIQQMQSSLSNKIDEAPKDDKQYARQNGAWVIVTGGGGSIDANALYHKGELLRYKDEVLTYKQIPCYIYHNNELIHHNNEIVFKQ